jgi:hypothetical protein
MFTSLGKEVLRLHEVPNIWHSEGCDKNIFRWLSIIFLTLPFSNQGMQFITQTLATDCLLSYMYWICYAAFMYGNDMIAEVMIIKLLVVKSIPCMFSSNLSLSLWLHHGLCPKIVLTFSIFWMPINWAYILWLISI